MHADGGVDSLVFGPGINVSDVLVHFSGTTGADLTVEVRDPASPGGAPNNLITLANWTDPKDRIELLVFADGGTLHIGSQLGAYQVPFGAALSGRTVAENSANGSVVGTVTGFDLQHGAARTYWMLDNAGGRFAINDPWSGVITVANGALLNYETASSYVITVRVDDLAGHVFDKSFAIGVTNVYEALTGATLSGGSVAENSASGTVVGIVTGSDSDPHAVLSYALADNAGGRFAINATTGVITVANGGLLDYDSATSHAIKVRTSDQQAHFLDKSFTIAVTDALDPDTTSALFAGLDFKLAAFAPGAGGWNSDNLYPRELADVNGDGMDRVIETYSPFTGNTNRLVFGPGIRASRRCRGKSRHSSRGSPPSFLATERTAPNARRNPLACIRQHCA